MPKTELDILDSSQNPSGINNPAIEDGKPTVPSVTDGKHAYSIYQKFEQDNIDRSTRNAAIIRNYNGALPRDTASRKSDNASWKSNFPTRTMASIVDQIVPIFTNFLEMGKSLTQSKLPEEVEGWEDKSELLRERWTKMVREWDGWRSLCSSFCQELVLIGYTFLIKPDKLDWRPLHYREDQAFVSEGTGQFAKYVQCCAAKQDFLIHELWEKVKEKEIAEAAKWKVQNVIDSLNKSLPYDPQRNQQGGTARTFEDMQREVNTGTSYQTGAKVVETAHVWAKETDTGKISHFIVDRNNTHATLLEHADESEAMEDILCLFTLKPGNSKFYGSYGVGREIVNPCIALDQVANDAVNNFRLTGILVVAWDNSKNLPQPKVKMPFLFINPEAKLDQKQGFPDNANSFVILWDKILDIIQRSVGAYISGVVEDPSKQQDKTATGERVDYQRELKSQSAVIARFAGQVANLIAMMQKASCDPETNDKEALEFQKYAAEELKLSPGNLMDWANSHPAEVLQDLTQQENQAKARISQQIIASRDEQFDQRKAREVWVTSEMGGNPAFAKEILNPEGIDPTMEVEQIRQQIMENEAIMSGASIPVSPRDNDEMHLKTLIPELAKGGKAMAANPMAVLNDPSHLDHMGAGITHGEAHVQRWAAKGAPPEVLKPYEDALKQADEMLTKFAEELQKVQQAMAQRQQQQPTAQDGAQMAEAGRQAGQMSEDILKAWIGQFANLSGEAQQRLETIGGLGPDPQSATKPPVETTPQPTETSPATPPPSTEVATPATPVAPTEAPAEPAPAETISS